MLYEIEHKMLDLSILQEKNKANSRIITLNFRRADFGLFRGFTWKTSIVYDPGKKKGPADLADFQKFPK